ncbi:hypothetical protein V5799_008219 [Amblyomma americanum]|uniref:Uncharacterized protein n=1 Tax=Amblyomma americanum TaxID=6943 RepID=A0AAQ4FFC9_AMBAM
MTTETPALETPVTSPPSVALKTSPNFLPVTAAVIGVAVSTFLLVLLVLAVVGGSKTGPALQNISSFCCPNEALAVLQVVNLSVDPCEDFYAHVCSRADAGTPEHMSPMFRIAMKRKMVELGSVRTSTSAAGQMLAAIKKRTRGRHRKELPGEDIAEFVTAVAQAAAVGQKVELFHVVRLFAVLSMRYGLQSLVSFSVSKSGTVAKIQRNDGCVLDSAYTDDVGSAADAFNKALHDTVNVAQLRQLHDNLKTTRGANHSKAASRSIASSPFSGLSEHEWAAISRDLIFSLHPNVTEVETREEDRLDEFLAVLLKAPHQITALAYIVICTAYMTRDKLDDTLSTEPVHGMRISCQLVGVCEIEDVFFAQVFSSRNTNNYVRGLFRSIRLNVTDQASAHPVLGGASKQAIARELDKLRLMLPEEIAASDLRVPTVSKTFVANLLAARSYAFDVRKAKVSRKIPTANSLSLPMVMRRGEVIYVPTNVYALLGQKPNKKAALGIPVVGVDMAAEMWSYLLERPWPDESRRNIKTRLECFKQKLLNASHHGDSVRAAAIALGVQSSIDAMMTAEWNTVAIVNDTQTSLGRLVYLTWVYDRCATVPGESRWDINLALQHSPGFAEAFGCAKGSTMTSPNCCLKSC